MEAVLTRLRDFSCKAVTFDDCKPPCRKPRTCADSSRDGVPMEGRAAEGGGPYNLDIESALAWLRRELLEMRSQDQALIRQLMDLHTGIQELKQELSEGEEDDEDGDDEEENEEEGASCWDSESERGSGSVYSSTGEVGLSVSYRKAKLPPLASRSSPRRLFSRRSSVP